MEEIDIWRSANKLIEMYGEKGIDYAVQRAEQLAKENDMLGAHVMARVAEAIEVLLRPHSEGQILH